MKKRASSVFSILLALIMIFSVVAPASSAFAATASGYITSASNTSSGVKINWKKDSGKTGYYIYRKFSYQSKWTKIKTIKGASTTTWTDTKAAVGSYYNYKVYSYKGSKTYTNTKTKTVCRISTPKITSISLSGDNIRIQSSEDANAGGYVIKYSKKSDFSDAKEITVYGKKLDKVVCDLSCSTKYYFKIRAFKTNKDVRYYSGYSSSKSYTTKGTYTRYTNKYENFVYAKATSSSAKTLLPYNSKLTMYQDVSVTTSGTWKKVKYNGVFYYIWLTPNDGKLTATKNNYIYTNDTNTPLQNEIINTAVDIFKNLDTEYDYNRKYSDGTMNPTTKKYPFDCSGLVRYVYHTVLQKYNKAYVLPTNALNMYNMKGANSVICNNGYPSEIKTQEVIAGTPTKPGKIDYSKLQPGDVIFFKMGFTKESVDHCGIYLGNKQFIHSVGTFNQVIITPLTEKKFVDGFICATRFLPNVASGDDIELINKDMCIGSDPNVWVYAYGNIDCKSDDNDKTRLHTGDTVTLLGICDNGVYSAARGYIEYTDGDGNTKRGFVFMDKVNLTEIE